MQDITKENIVASSSQKRLDVIYNSNGKSVKYAKVSLAVVNNPYTGKPEVAAKPYVKNAFGELVPLYSFEEDIQYQECMRIAADCTFKGEKIPKDVDDFVRNMMTRKEMARNQADTYVSEQLGIGRDSVSTAYTRSEWREDVVNSPEAQQMLAEYKAQTNTQSADTSKSNQTPPVQ